MRLEEAVSTSSGGVAWPVVIIGGFIIIAGLVALRVEFRNLRTRRAERRRTR